MKKAIVCGAGGFIGGHMVKRLLDEGYKVVALDIKHRQDWYQVHEDALNEGVFDLRDADNVNNVFRKASVDEVYQFAADMGGAGYIFTGEHDADVMHNSATINLNIAHAVAALSPKTKVFYSSSACIYPAHNQTDPDNPNCEESSAYPAHPDSEYGWEKLFSERLYRSYARNYGLNVRIARFHNIFGPYGTWDGGKEKAPAAMCRKALQASESMEVWGPGTQTRSFLYIDECIEAVRRLMESDVETVINIGSDEMISINNLARMALDLADKQNIELKNIDGPVGVMGRCSDNNLIEEKLGWRPSEPLVDGMKKTLNWIAEQLEK
jgi:GDP-D-mannose 3', 5'-epimerase